MALLHHTSWRHILVAKLILKRSKISRNRNFTFLKRESYAAAHAFNSAISSSSSAAAVAVT